MARVCVCASVYYSHRISNPHGLYSTGERSCANVYILLSLFAVCFRFFIEFDMSNGCAHCA